MKSNYLGLSMLCALAFAATATTDANFVNDKSAAQGWHFYGEPEPEEPKKPELPPVPIAPPSAAKSGPEPMSTKWIRAHFMEFVGEAINDPSPENIQRARYMQRVIMDKATAFREAWMQDVINNPLLDETQARPTSSFALNAKNEAKNRAEQEVVQEVANQAGLWFFFESTCDYCKRQAPIVQRLMSKYGFNVNAISIDLAPMENGMFPEYQPDTKQKYKELGVQRVPALFLVGNSGEFVAPISQGIVTESEIVRLVLIQAKTANVISEEQFNDASAVELLQQITRFEDIDEERALTDANYLVEILESNLKAQQGY